MSVALNEREPLLEESRHSAEHVEIENHTTKPLSEETNGIRLYLALVFTLMGLMFVALDVTMVSTVSATIATEFDSLAVVSWLGSAYLVAVAAIQPISGKLTDRLGRRTGLFWALFFFGAGNLMCGLAPTEAVLIAGRVVAGMGGGAISSIGAFVTSDLLPLRERPMWQGLGNVFWAVGMGLGGVFGGVINDTIGWRWTFFIMIPCTLLATLGIYFTLVRGLPRLPQGVDSKPTKGIDILGSLLLTGALVSFVIGLNLQEKGKSQLLSSILLVVATVFFVCFVIAETKFVADPVVPIYLLKNRSVLGVCVAGLLISISMYSMLFYVPVLIQVRGYSTSEVGLQSLGNPLGSAIGPFCIGLTMRTMGHYTYIKPLVYLIYLVGTIGFFFSTLGTPVWATIIFMVFLGAGFGSVLTFNLTGMLANIDDSLQASATSMQYAFRQIGASGGLAISGIIFRTFVEKNLQHSASKSTSLYIGLEAPEKISSECSRNNYIGNEPPRACQIYFNALHKVFLFTLMTAAVGFLFGMMVRNRSLDRDNDKRVDDES